MMFDRDDPLNLWVSSSAADCGDGTADNPFADIDDALHIVKPGMRIVLAAGIYERNVTFEISGDLHEPVVLTADIGAEVEVRNSCWFFYDSSDLVVSGIKFANAPHAAISIIGACLRNRFEKLSFLNCGTEKETACTLYFGGGGGSCNIVEDCLFERPERHGQADDSIALMVAEGNADGGELITDHLFRRNRFVNYGYGIIVGTNDTTGNECGHIVEYNTLENCTREAVLVKCGDTLVRHNVVLRCPLGSISVAAGSSSTVESNRLVDCGNGIRISGNGHTVLNNCLVRCGASGVLALGGSDQIKRSAASNLFIEKNTFIDCSAVAPAVVRMEIGTSGIITNNLFSGAVPAIQADPTARYVMTDNITTEKDAAAAGISGLLYTSVTFKDRAADDFENDAAQGAKGLMLKPDGIPIAATESVENQGHVSVCGEDDDDECDCGDGSIVEESADDDYNGTVLSSDEIISTMFMVGEESGANRE